MKLRIRCLGASDAFEDGMWCVDMHRVVDGTFEPPYPYGGVLEFCDHKGKWWPVEVVPPQDIQQKP